MNWTFSLFLLAAVPAQPQVDEMQLGTHYTNYHLAHRIAHQTGKPMLIIFQKGANSSSSEVSLVSVRKTRIRRELLGKYVVLIIDTTTPHGQVVYKAYKQPKLPHVVILGKKQEYQIFTTSEKLYGQRWTEILKTYADGKLRSHFKDAAFCAT